NAVEYSVPGSEIVISAKQSGHRVELTLANQAASQLSATDIEHFCEPFWRGDQAHQSREHAGLGLALGRAFAELLGGKLSLSLEGHRTFVARLQLPLGNDSPNKGARDGRPAAAKI